MKKYSTVIGMDLGDKTSMYAVLVEGQEEPEMEGRVSTTRAGITRFFSRMDPCLVVIEVGTHSPWVSALLGDLGHTVIVANARRLRMIYDNDRKSDRVDALTLARVGRLEPALLHGISHRSGAAQADMALLRARDGLVRARTRLISQVRGLVKSFGERLPKCDAHYFHRKALSAVPEALRPALAPLLSVLETISETIGAMDRQIEGMCEEKYEETGLLRKIKGVGAVTSLAFVLAIENPQRFSRSRDVGAYLGLVPRRDQSGGHDPQLRITKAGNAFVRRLLVQAAQYLLGPFGEECDLRRWGLKRAGEGNKRAKRIAIVAVARKLAVLLHRLWVSGEVYDPHMHESAQSQAA